MLLNAVAVSALCAQGSTATTIVRQRLADSAAFPSYSSRLLWLGPDVRLVWNSDIPFSVNDGPMWAGRGLNAQIGGGGSASFDVRGTIVHVIANPVLLYSQNAPFPIFIDTLSDRSAFANPFHGPGASIDAPLRFGDLYLLRLDPGLSALEVIRDGVRATLTARNDWWGPGIRNTLVMSNNAPGIPRLELALTPPRRTRAGLLEATLIAGTLTESAFFDTLAFDDYRAISGARVAIRPAFDTSLVLGLARTVYSTIESPLIGPLAHAADVLIRWEPIHAGQRSDQITSLFARWAFPQSGFEVHAEWSRSDLPRSLTELLLAFNQTAAYVLGLQWEMPQGIGRAWRLQTEFAYLEQSTVLPGRPVPDYYTSEVSPQGYTNRGQVIGAAVGPGGSSQWLALDYAAPGWQLGSFVERIRWENDALYRQFAPNFVRHDVTVRAGLRGWLRTKWTDFGAEAGFGYRFNYLFQNGYANPGGFRFVDVRNLTVSLSATPRRSAAPARDARSP